jgi:hypothetical protein
LVSPEEEENSKYKGGGFERKDRGGVTSDRRNFNVISRSSVFESIAILDVLIDEGVIGESFSNEYYARGEELLKILFRTIKNLQTN